MVLIGGGWHCRAAVAPPEALLLSAGVTDCLACNPSCMYTHALQMQVSVNASSCTTELVLTAAQQGCSTGLLFIMHMNLCMHTLLVAQHA